MKICKSLVMGNCIRLLHAKLRYTARFTAGVFIETFSMKRFANFKKIQTFQLRISKNGCRIKF